MNTYLQCNRYCNRGLSGNIEGNKSTIGYKKGLVHRFGESRAKDILDYLESKHENTKLLESDYIEMRSRFNARARELKKILESYN